MLGAVKLAEDSPEFSAVWAYTPFDDPFLLVAFLQTGQSGKFRFCGDPVFWEFVLSCE
jgi:hypothetical protein